MRHLDLFSGIGGFALSASWCWPEHKVVAFCEIDPFCQQVLKKHWPDTPIIPDIHDLTLDNIVNLWYNCLTENIKQEVDMSAKRKNYDEAKRMYDRGLSIQTVADFYEVTRQAMWAILKRRGCEFRPHLKYGEDNHFYRGTNASDKAQNILEEAIERGIVARKAKCEKCGDTPTFKDGRTGIQAHHSDYNKPLDVAWLCQKCHHEWHKHNKAIPREEVMPCEAIRNLKTDLLTGGFP